MAYTKEYDIRGIKSGDQIRCKTGGKYEYFVIGDYYVDRGWELMPNGHDSVELAGVLLYLHPLKFRSEGFELNVID